MKYRYQIDKTEPAGWRETLANTPREAAIYRAARAARNYLGLGEFRCTVYVAEANGPRHANGAPIVVHAFDCVCTPTNRGTP